MGTAHEGCHVILVPVPAAAAALDTLGTVERLPELSSDHMELICIVAHLGTACAPRYRRCSAATATCCFAVSPAAATSNA